MLHYCSAKLTQIPREDIAHHNNWRQMGGIEDIYISWLMVPRQGSYVLFLYISD